VVPPARDDMRLLLFAGAAVIFAGLAVAAALLFSTSRGDDTPTTPEPVRLGFESSAKDRLEEDPDFIPDQFGGDRSFWLTLEGDEVAAIAVNPTDMDCTVDWRGRIDRFVCGDGRFRSQELERFEVRVPDAGDDKGVLIVDVRRRLPAPELPAG
jgi:hypothetical protein